MKPKERFHQLDTLRGLAALAVVLHHCLLIPSSFDRSWASWVLGNTPLGIFRAGTEGVGLFFILSGFVLALQFYEGEVRYGAYLLKRVCRIWLPHCGALLLAIISVAIIQPRAIPDLGAWFNATWTSPVTPKMILEHLTLVGSFRSDSLNTALWSLVHEMRLSIVFPVIPMLVFRWNPHKLITLAIGLIGAGTLAYFILLPRIGDWADWFMSVSVFGLFIIGALIARHRGTIVETYNRWGTRRKTLWLAAAVLFYSIKYWLPITRHIHGKMLFQYAGAAMIIMAAIASGTMQRLLSLRPLHYLGLISFGVYLLHGNVLFAYVHLFHDRMSMGTLWILTFATTLPLAALFYHGVERPSIRLGQRILRSLPPGGDRVV